MASIGLSKAMDVLIYSGHYIGKRVYGPYHDSVLQDERMFQLVNQLCNNTWNITQVYGHELVERLSHIDVDKSLFVFPAGPSSEFDKIFSEEQLALIKQKVEEGMSLYATCGSAYFLSKLRIWKGGETSLTKDSPLPLFQGRAVGPLCLKQNSGTKSEVCHEPVLIEGHKVVLLLSGGGSFFYEKEESKNIKVLARYSADDLTRLGRDQSWDKAVIGFQYGIGKVVLSMIHPATGKEDIQDSFKKTFPDHDWDLIKDRLSDLGTRGNYMQDILSFFTT